MPVPFTDNNLMRIFSINNVQAEFSNYDRKDVLNELYKTYILRYSSYNKNNDIHLITKTKTKMGQWYTPASYIITDNSYTYNIKETGQKPSIENYIQEIKLIGQALQYNENNVSKDELIYIIVQYIMPLILIDQNKESIDFKQFVSLLNHNEYLKKLPENVQ